MSHFMTPEFQQSLAVRVDGRPYPITFTGENNRTTAVEGHNLPDRGGNRQVHTNWGNKPIADFETPLRALIHYCNEVYKNEGMEGLQKRLDVAQAHPHDVQTLKDACTLMDGELPAIIDRYVDSWKKVMGNAESPVIFREDLADIARTFQAAEQAKGQQAAASR